MRHIGCVIQSTSETALRPQCHPTHMVQQPGVDVSVPVIFTGRDLDEVALLFVEWKSKDLTIGQSCVVRIERGDLVLLCAHEVSMDTSVPYRGGAVCREGFIHNRLALMDWVTAYVVQCWNVLGR